MPDPYLYDDVAVLRNKLAIKAGDILDLIEAEQSRANMMLLYDQGFRDFSPEGLCEIHKFLFGDIYEWAGQYRIINIEKREKLLGGRSVWYSNDDTIPQDLQAAFCALNEHIWKNDSREAFVHALTRLFQPIWQVHPFREGNTRAVVMMILFVEYHGYYMDHELLASSAGYVRDAFVMASIDHLSEYEHLERILMDAVCSKPVEYDDGNLDSDLQAQRKYQKYQTEKYVPTPHQQRTEGN